MVVRVIGTSLLAIGLIAGAAFAELPVTLEPVEVSRFVYEPFTLRLQTADDAETPVVPSAPGYSVTGIIREAGIFNIEIIPEEAGTLTIPAMKKVSVSCATVDVVPSVARTSGSEEM